MTISSSNRKAGPFTGNGVTTAFPFTFKVFTTADLLVVLANSSTGVESTQALTTNYTVTLNSDQNANPGGTVTMLVAPATGYTLTLTSQVAQTQSVDLTNAGGFYPSVINIAFDKLTILIQQMQTYLTGALKLPISASGVSATLPTPSAGKLLGWSADGLSITNLSAAGNDTTAIQNSAYQVLGSVAGTNTITASATPAIAAYTAGLTVRFVAAGANTGAVTININGLGAKSITKNGTTALEAGDISSGAVVQVTYDGAQFQLSSLPSALSGITSINGGQLAGLRNRLINGNMVVAQRGNVTFAGTQFTYGGPDRWSIAYNGSGYAATLTQGSDTNFTSGKCFALTGVNITSGNYIFAQAIEAQNAVSLNGKTVTVRFRVYHDIGSTVNVVGQLYKANSADNFSATTLIGAIGGVIYTAASGVYTDISGSLTLGATDGSNGVMLRISVGSGNTFTSKTIKLGDVQLELGSVATPFEHRPYGMELALCQRYYQTSGATETIFSSNVTNSQLYYLSVRFPVLMRAAPTVTPTNTSAVSFPASASAAAGVSGAGCYLSRTANATAYGQFQDTWTASAEL